MKSFGRDPFVHNFIETEGNATEACRMMGSTSPKQLSYWHMNRPAVKRKIAEFVQSDSFEFAPQKLFGILSEYLHSGDPAR